MADDTKLISQYQASKIDEYYKIYKTYLMDHGLSDDANSITIESLVNFVENHILSEQTPDPKNCKIILDKIDLHLLRQQKHTICVLHDRLEQNSNISEEE